MAKKTRFSKAARLIPGPGLVALLSLSPSLTGVAAVARDVPPAPVSVVVAPKAAAAPMRVADVSPQAGTAAPAAAPGTAPWSAAPIAPAAPRAHRGSVGCLIGPERSADIGSAVTGVISSIPVERGDTVRQGQTLVVLQHDVERANVKAVAARHAIESDVRSAEANLALARERHERFASLVGSGAIATLTADQAKAEYDVALQRLQQARGQREVVLQELGVARAQLAQRTLRAPFDGVVVEQLAYEGERVEDRPLLRLAQLDPLRIELVMPAARWGSVKPGDAMSIVPELPGTPKLTAKVTHIDRTLDAASNTFRVRLSLPNPDLGIPAGARCRLEGPPDFAGKLAEPGSGADPASGQSVPGMPPAAAVEPAAARPAAAPRPRSAA